MLDPDSKVERNSTWESLPRRQLVLKFFASLVLLGFLVGMMLGRLFNPAVLPLYANQIVQLQTYADGLGVCLTRAAQVQASHQQGAYQLLLLDTRGQAAQDELILAKNALVRWRLEPQENHINIVFIGLQALAGQWHQRRSDGHWCIDIQIRLAEGADQ